MKKISVIIPVYNIEQYLSKCLKSIEDQSVFQNLEIILIDDGSKDNSGKICDTFATKYKNVIVIHKKNGGVSSARNVGIEIATGEYISFVDGDDYLSPSHFEEMIVDINDSYYDLIVHDYFVKFDNSYYKYRKRTRIKEFNQNDAIKDLLSGGVIGNNLFDKSFKKDTIKDIKFDPKIKIGEDLYFIFLFLMNSKKIYSRPVATYYYIQREGSAMNSSFNEKYFDIIKVSELIQKNIKVYRPDLMNYAQSLKIYSMYKTLERAYKHNAYNEYKNILLPLKKCIKQYSINNAIRYLSLKKMMGFLLIKYFPKIYLFVCKIKKI